MTYKCSEQGQIRACQFIDRARKETAGPRRSSYGLLDDHNTAHFITKIFVKNITITEQECQAPNFNFIYIKNLTRNRSRIGNSQPSRTVSSPSMCLRVVGCSAARGNTCRAQCCHMITNIFGI